MQTLCEELNYNPSKKLKDFNNLLSDNIINKHEYVGYIKSNVIRIKCHDIFDLARLQLRREENDYNDFDLMLDRAFIIRKAVCYSKDIKKLYENIFSYS